MVKLSDEIPDEKRNRLNAEFGKSTLDSYWDLFIADALLGNFDRHANNWGYLINEDTGSIKLAPVYDCGSCLYPQLSDDALPDILNSCEEISMRINKFPTAALTLENRKVNYRDYIVSGSNPDCANALFRVFPKINLKKVNGIIDNTEGISDIRKLFYKTMLKERYERILVPAIEKTIQNEKKKVKIRNSYER